MTTTWFTSDTERAMPEQWTRVEILASNAIGAQAALDELSHHIRIPAGYRGGPMPSRNTSFPLLPFVAVAVGEAYRDWTANELEWQLRRIARDPSLQVMVAHITGWAAVQHSSRTYYNGATGPIQSLFEGVGGVATGVGDLASGAGGAASGVGDALGSAGASLSRWREWVGPIVAVVMIILLLALAWTSPTWIPKVIR